MPYLKNEAFLELVCTLSTPNKSITESEFIPTFKDVLSHLFLKVLLQFLLHSTQLVTLYIKTLVFYDFSVKKSLGKRRLPLLLLVVPTSTSRHLSHIFCIAKCFDYLDGS